MIKNIFMFFLAIQVFASLEDDVTWDSEKDSCARLTPSESQEGRQDVGQHLGLFLDSPAKAFERIACDWQDRQVSLEDLVSFVTENVKDYGAVMGMGVHWFLQDINRYVYGIHQQYGVISAIKTLYLFADFMSLLNKRSATDAEWEDVFYHEQDFLTMFADHDGSDFVKNKNKCFKGVEHFSGKCHDWQMLDFLSGSKTKIRWFPSEELATITERLGAVLAGLDPVFLPALNGHVHLYNGDLLSEIDSDEKGKRGVWRYARRQMSLALGWKRAKDTPGFGWDAEKRRADVLESIEKSPTLEEKIFEVFVCNFSTFGYCFDIFIENAIRKGQLDDLKGAEGAYHVVQLFKSYLYRLRV